MDSVFVVPYTKAVAVTPNDGTNLAAGATQAIYIGGAGNLAVIMWEDFRRGITTPVTFTGVTVGSVLRISAVRIMATNTTATALVALY